MDYIESRNLLEQMLQLEKYFPQQGTVHVHLSRVKPCPLDLPAGMYWYGSKRAGPRRPPKWTQQITDQESFENNSRRSRRAHLWGGESVNEQWSCQVEHRVNRKRLLWSRVVVTHSLSHNAVSVSVWYLPTNVCTNLKDQSFFGDSWQRTKLHF